MNDAPIDKAEYYYYKHALTLLSRAPLAASKSFLNRYTEGLSETTLLPSFMHYERKRMEHKSFNDDQNHTKNSSPSSDKRDKRVFEIENARTHGDSEMEVSNLTNSAPSSFFVDDAKASIHYLEGVIKLGSQSRAIYNYLASLYASMDDEGPLFRYLSTHVTTAVDHPQSIVGVSELMMRHNNTENLTPLDLSYVLRRILQTGRHMRSAVKLYMVSITATGFSYWHVLYITLNISIHLTGLWHATASC